MQLSFIDAGGFETAVYEWGDRSSPTIFCAHGLGGQGQNFRMIAETVSSEFHVIAPDLIGRGHSQWATDASADYSFDCYAQIVGDILSHKRVSKFHWIGVSMGGALGLRLAGGPEAARFKSLTLNDIGPILDEKVAADIQAAVSKPIRAKRFSDLVAAYETMFGTFGMKPSSGRTWQDMALEGARRTDDGCWTLHFDTRVAEQFSHAPADFNQAESFKQLSVPIHVFRGTESTVLTRAGLNEMRRLQPGLQFIEVQNVGHAPLLDQTEELQKILDFLRRAERSDQDGAET